MSAPYAHVKAGLTASDTHVYTIKFATMNNSYELKVTTPRQGPFCIHDIDVGFQSTIDIRRIKGQPGGRRKNCAIVFTSLKDFQLHRVGNDKMYLSSGSDAELSVFMYIQGDTPSILVVRILNSPDGIESLQYGEEYHLYLQTGEIKDKSGEIKDK